jgi:class 3 adenylate cyclase
MRTIDGGHRRGLFRYFGIEAAGGKPLHQSAALAALSGKLAKYLAPQVYDPIFTARQDVRITSQRKKLTICFSDMAGFTETTDRMESAR